MVIGAGAAGLMCARVAAHAGKKVLVLEHQRQAGRKVLISGGGRCNFTNLNTRAEHFLSENPHFVRSALSRFTPHDFLGLMAAHGLTWNDKGEGQLFCDQGAKAVRDMLVAECRAAGATLRTGVRVGEVKRTDAGFAVVAEEMATKAWPEGRAPHDDRAVDARSSSIPGNLLGCKKLVIATGGLSIPKLGATPFGYRIAEQFGVPVVSPRAGLVPFTLAEADRKIWGALSGLSVDVRLSCGDAAFTGPLLFTHRGLSGPVALNASSYWVPGQALTINLFPGIDLYDHLKKERSKRPKAALRTVLGAFLPRNLARVVCSRLVADDQLARLSDAVLRQTVEALCGWRITPSGTEGYRTAEVTVGGVDTRALSSKTMAANDVPGLHFIGEVVDVTGMLGGFNFQWAWASGHAAGEAV